MNDLGSKLTALDQRADSVRSRLAELANQRRAESVAALDDQAGLQRVLQLDIQAGQLERELSLIHDAKLEIESLQAKDAAAAAAAERDQRRAEAKRLVGEIMAVNHQLDGSMILLRQQLQHRADLLRQLIATHIVSEPFVQRLMGKYPVTAAARAAGLDKFVALEYVAPGHIQPLMESNRGLGANGMTPTPQPKAKITRLRPREGVIA
jgi:hypothetical protein